MILSVPTLLVANQGQHLNPTQIAGCVLWLDASQMGLTDGTAVSTWSDLSGSANDATQATGTNQPVFHTNIISTLPAVLFDGSNDFMSYSDFVASKPMSIFVVTQPTLNTASQKTYATLIHGQAGTFIFFAKLSTSFWGTFTSGDVSSGNALVSGTNYLLENTTASGSTLLYQRGLQVATNNSNEVGSNSPPSIGKDTGNAGREYAGYLAEIIAYNTVLSADDRKRVENYLITKYAL